MNTLKDMADKLPGTNQELNFEQKSVELLSVFQQEQPSSDTQLTESNRTELMEFIASAKMTEKNPFNRYFLISGQVGRNRMLYDKHTKTTVDWDTLINQIYREQHPDKIHFKYGKFAQLLRIVQSNYNVLQPFASPGELGDFLFRSRDLKILNLVYDPFRETGYNVEDKFEIDTHNEFWMPPIESKSTPGGDVWMQFLTNRVEDEYERNILLQYLAHLVQRPGQRTLWAPSLYSHTKGSGKDTVLDPIIQLLGRHNVYEKSIDEGNWTNFVSNKILIYLHDIENTQNIYKMIKTMITDSRVEIVAKYKDSVNVDNIASFIVTTNYLSSFTEGVESEDRRHNLIQFRENKPEEDAESELLRYQIYDADGVGCYSDREKRVWSDDYLAGIKYHLEQVDLSNFPVTAPMTDLTRRALEMNISRIGELILGVLAEENHVLAKTEFARILREGKNATGKFQVGDLRNALIIDRTASFNFLPTALQRVELKQLSREIKQFTGLSRPPDHSSWSCSLLLDAAHRKMGLE